VRVIAIVRRKTEIAKRKNNTKLIKMHRQAVGLLSIYSIVHYKREGKIHEYERMNICKYNAAHPMNNFTVT
jgi:hypothetical protein